MKIRIFFVAAMCCFAIPAAGATFNLNDIPPYPMAELICREHVTGSSMHLLWRSFGTADSIATVVAYFEKYLSTRAEAGEHDSFKLVSKENPDLVTTIFTIPNLGHFPHCEKKPDPSAKTVILISQAIRGTSP